MGQAALSGGFVLFFFLSLFALCFYSERILCPSPPTAFFLVTTIYVELCQPDSYIVLKPKAD
jgi:hypothetical protein